MNKKDFEQFCFSHYDTDAEFVADLRKLNKKWDKSKFSRIKTGEQMPKLIDAVEMSKATKTPLVEVARFFCTL